MNEKQVAQKLLADARATARARQRLPESTYRMQFHAGFTFRDALAVVPYLHDLGVTHLYASPYFKAQPGSTHGYDIVDYASVNPEIGSDAELALLTRCLSEHGMGQIVDFVPNHMGVGSSDNAWWNDVLEHGRRSRFASFFDIAWRASPRPELVDKILLPVLGEPYGDVLESGGLTLSFRDDSFFVSYQERAFPLTPSSYAFVLEHRLEEWAIKIDGPGEPAIRELKSILDAIHRLAPFSETETQTAAAYHDEQQAIKLRLGALAAQSDTARGFIDENVAIFNGKAGDPRSFDLIDQLLEQQCYRLAYWRVAPDEINYRRFFDVNGLAALKMEREDVFEAANGLVLAWAAQGALDGIRIDHPDGLFDPKQYFERLEQHYVLACARQAFATDDALQGHHWEDVQGLIRRELASGDSGPAETARGPLLYVVAEKILATGESLCENWTVHGTTGYEFLNEVNGLFVDESGRDPLSRLYRSLASDETRFPELAYRKKRLILDVSLSSELHMLTSQLDRLAQRSRRSRDFTFNTLRLALAEVIASFPVYRTYIDDSGPHAGDRQFVETAVRRASFRNPLLSRRVFGFIRDILIGQPPEEFSESDCAERRLFAGSFQQVTSPVAAKGVEDTAFYVDNRLISLNEVGGDPDRFGNPPRSLHTFNQLRQSKWPHALSPLSTHDTKRSEDVRARINILSEVPQEWAEGVERWTRQNEPCRQPVGDTIAPDANEEYLLYQTLMGAWPLEPYSENEFGEFVQRIQAYARKALHEAKVHSSWLNPNIEYDDAVIEFLRRILDENRNQEFLDDFRTLNRRVSRFGLLNSLSMTLLKLASPGVPDTYQGSELWDFSLVDPDNRRPVDYPKRQRLLEKLKGEIHAAGSDLRGLCRDLAASMEDGRIKLYIHLRALQFRRSHPGLLSAGQYRPANGTGPKAEHVFAFARSAGQVQTLAAVPRLWTRLLSDPFRPPAGRDLWEDTWLELDGIDPATRWQDIFTGAIHCAVDRAGASSLALADLFQFFPVALLVNVAAGP
jgi:(1->4)-alpha-D-glucan 1-alpha-D-glucosylmutase